MEWSDIYGPDSDPFLLSSVTPQFEVDDQQQHTDWTFEENKLFENTLAEFGLDSPALFEHVASRLPTKSMEQIKRHYDCLLEDVEMIEAGLFPTPNYVSTEGSEEGGDLAENAAKNDHEKGSSSTKQARKTCIQRKRGVPWTEEEHKLFLMGLNKYGKGDWRSISRYYVVTKTPTQVASHAQKFFRRQTSTTPPDRRRPSIHDIQTVNSTFFPLPQMQHKDPPITNSNTTSEVLLQQQQQPVLIPNVYAPAYGLVPVYSNSNINNNNNNFFNGCELTNFADESPVFPAAGTSTFPMANNSMFNQPSGIYPPYSSYQFPYPRNYP